MQVETRHAASPDRSQRNANRQLATGNQQLLPRAMGKGQRNYVTAVDVGSSKTCVLVAEATDAGLRYAAHAVAESRGSRKGVIVDLKKAVESVQKAAAELEETSGIPVEHVVAGVAGAH